MNIAYEDDVENQLQNEPNINGWESDNILDLQNRFSNQLFEVCKESLPIVMLSFALNMNQTGIDIDTIMSQSQLQEYLKSPQARFVYACLTAEYVSADDALSAWKELKGFLSKENGDYRPLLYDTLHQQHIQRERRYLSNDGGIVSIPVRHDCMLSLRSRPRHQYRLDPHFVNAATFRGLVSLSEGDLKAASAHFRESGLLQYSAAVELCMLYNGKDMEVKDLISLFANFSSKSTTHSLTRFTQNCLKITKQCMMTLKITTQCMMIIGISCLE